MSITFKQTGDFSKVTKYLNSIKGRNYRSTLEKYAEEGVQALRDNTPIDTGITSESWAYEIVTTAKGFSIIWTNSNVTDSGVPIVILLQYGHGTRSGSFVQGIDFINPTMKPIFDKIVESLWKEVESL